MAVFYGLYFFAFRKFTFHALNRFYLLCTLVLSFLIPLISFETKRIVKVEPAVTVQQLPAISTPTYTSAYAPAYHNQAQAKVTSSKEAPDWRFYLIFGYLTVAAIIMVFFSMKLFKIYQLSRRAVKADNLRIVQGSGQLSNASFFNLIFLNTDGLTDNEKAQIIAHEYVHIRQKHSIDILLTEIIKIILWFNPIIYFYKKSLVEIHEFEADLYTIQQFDSKNYAHLLLKLGISYSTDLTNQFSLHPLSTRIQFLFKKRTSAIKKGFYFFGLPLLALGVFAFAGRNEKLIYEKMALNKIKSKAENFPEVLKTVEKDSTTTQQELEPLVSINQADSAKNLLKPLINPFLLKTPEIKLPEPNKISGTRDVRAILNIQSTPASYSLDLMKNGRFVTETAKEEDIKIFQKEVELLKGEDYEFIYEKGIITEVRFKEHIQNASVGISIQIKYDTMAPLPQTKPEAIPLPSIYQKAPGNTNSLWRYNNIGVSYQKFNSALDTLRTFMPANFLGKEPLVIINGQEYPSSILYKINPKSFNWYSLADPNEPQALKKYGEKGRDGVIEIRTKDNVLFKTTNEQQLVIENTKRELDALKVYKNDKIVRVRLLDNGGKEFERVIIKGFFNNRNISVDIPLNGKIEYKLNGKLVSENDIITYSGIFYGSNTWENMGKPDRKGNNAGINIKTKK